MQDVSDIAGRQSGDFADLLVAEVLLKLQQNQLALAVGQSVNQFEQRGNCLLFALFPGMVLPGFFWTLMLSGLSKWLMRFSFLSILRH